MKNGLNVLVFAVLFGTLFLPGRAWAQLQLNLTGNHLSSAESGARFSEGLWGGGATLRYFVSPRFALSVNGRYFTHSQSAIFNGSVTARTRFNTILATAQAEYFFTTSTLRPYVGVEVGLYQPSTKTEYTNVPPAFATGTVRINYYDVAPKLGLQYAITPAFGLNVDAGYHFIFNRNNYTVKDLILGAGVFYTFGRR